MYGGIEQSPDGSRALVDQASVIDMTGTGLGTVQIPGLPTYAVSWADDNRHLCALGIPQASGPESLWLLQPGAAARKIADVGPHISEDGATCSVAANRAVVVHTRRFHYPPPQGTPYQVTTLLQVLDLSSGRILFAHDYGPDLPNTLTQAWASLDGRYLVEENILQKKTTVTELATGHIIATLTNAWVTEISADDREVAIHAVGANMDETRVANLATGRVIWKGQGSLSVRFRPGSSDFLVRLDDPAGDYDLLLVPSAGSPRIIARQVFVTW
jgi:hypothetical protein